MIKHSIAFHILFTISFFLLALNNNSFNIKWVNNFKGDFAFSRRQNLECDAWCYEYAGVSHIVTKKLSSDTIECYTLRDVGTHSALHFYLVKDEVCKPRIELTSIVRSKGGSHRIYHCKSCTMKIDTKYYKKGILKAEFDMEFDHPENINQKMYWKGKIFSRIK
ncbi:MAG: hypothetical protein JNJ85_05145 [Candidatus Kapabacteria bacterium]|nr:hypothetical protein [Candidatus Kapabacteria bacterium]